MTQAPRGGSSGGLGRDDVPGARLPSPLADDNDLVGR